MRSSTTRRLTFATNRLALGYVLVHTALAALAMRRVDVPTRVFLINAFIAVWYVAILVLRRRTQAFERGFGLYVALWVPVLFFYWCYRWSGWTLHAFFFPGYTWDAAFIAFEAKFGQPALWMARKGSRWLTELLSGFYATYYFYTVFIGIALFAMRRYRAFEEMTFAVLFGYALSYVVFALVPLWGPRWALVDMGALDVSEQRLSGYVITDLLNRIQYDGIALKGGAMPSSHTSTAVVFAAWCRRIWGWRGGVPAWIIVAGMAVGAVYGRYHYATDLAAGVVIAMVGMWLARNRIGSERSPA